MAKISTVKLERRNCLEALQDIDPDSIDLILTDPPYNLGLFMKDRDTNLPAMRENHFVGSSWDHDAPGEWESHMLEFFEQSSRILKKGGSMIVFMSIMKVETLIKFAMQAGLYYKTTGIWHKKNPMPRNMNLHFINSTEAWIYFTNGTKTGTFNNDGLAVHDFVETSIINPSERKFGKHPTQKPVKLMEHFVRLLTNENETVLDPFMGSGSTGVACSLLSRSFHGIELDEEYFQIASSRISDTECSLDFS